MTRNSLWLAVPALCAAGYALAQGSLLDIAASQVISKYERSTCDQLKMDKSRPKSPEQMRAVQFLRNNEVARTAFLNKVAGPIANKMFECGMLP